MRPPWPCTEKCQKKNHNQYCSKHFHASLPCMQRSCLTCTASPCRGRRCTTSLLAKTSNRRIDWAIGLCPSMWINASVAHLLSVGCTFCPPRSVGDPAVRAQGHGVMKFEIGRGINRLCRSLRGLLVGHAPVQGPWWQTSRYPRPRMTYLCVCLRLVL